MKQTMKQFELHPMRLLAGACGLFTLLALAPASVAQQAALAATKTVASPTTQSAVAKPAAKAVESAMPNSANQQGIKVHGHWVLQVKNADGTLGERREFDNSLVTSTATSGGGGKRGECLRGPGVGAAALRQCFSWRSGNRLHPQRSQHGRSDAAMLQFREHE